MKTTIYERAARPEDAELTIGTCFLKKAALSAKQEAEILREADAWQLQEEVSYTETLFWRNDEERSSGYRNLHTCSEYVAQNGRFWGVVLRFSNEHGFGMSYEKEQQLGLLCIDGTSFGVVTRETSRTSTEVDRTETGVFTLTKK